MYVSNGFLTSLNSIKIYFKYFKKTYTDYKNKNQICFTFFSVYPLTATAIDPFTASRLSFRSHIVIFGNKNIFYFIIFRKRDCIMEGILTYLG